MTKHLRLLDAFCGEGGAARGYADAGFAVFGVDTSQTRLARYPYECDSADAIEYILAHGDEYDLIHASPPCTGYSRATIGIPNRDTRYERLIAATRAALDHVGVPYVIENVEGARPEMRHPILLCGRMFGLYTHDTDGTLLVLDRHRLFESTLPLRAPHHPPHHRGKVRVGGAYGGGRNDRAEALHVRGGGYTPHLAIRQRLLGITWMSQIGTSLAIPPAYTHWIGKRLRVQLAQPGTGSTSIKEEA